MEINPKAAMVAAGAALALYVFFSVKKAGGLGAVAADAGTAAVKAAAEAVDGAVGGVVMGIGDMIGVPRTNDQLCSEYMRNGQTWEAGLYCPATKFLPWLVGLGGGGGDVGATEITTAGDARGWRYFSDGTAISPDGAYYKNGQLIYAG